MIKEYYNELEKAVKTMAYVNKMSQKEQKYKTEELFFQNLESETKLELIKQQLTTTEKAIEYISVIENTLISIEQNELINKHPNILKPNHPEYNALNYTKNSEEVRKKYCPYHKSRFHDKSECNKMKDKSKNYTNPNKPKNDFVNTIKEPLNNTSLIKLPIKINKYEALAMVDTGSQH